MIFKTDKERERAYRNAFSNPQNIEVLVDILGELRFWNTFEKANDPLTPVERNILNLSAKRILEKCGFWKPENYNIITANMLGIIPQKRRRWWQRK